MEITKKLRKLQTKVSENLEVTGELDFGIHLWCFVPFIVLQEKPDDKEAFHCKVISLIHQSCFREAIDVINSAPKKG